MAEFPALPLWTDAYLADTADLDACEHGCYLILLMIAWRRPDCSLPNDAEWMRRSLNAYCGGRMHGNRFNSIVPKLLSRFFTLDAEGKWQQKRLRKERDFVLNFSRSQREKIQKRWAKVRENKELADTMVIPAGNTPTPTPTPKEERKKDNNTGNGVDYAFEHGCVKLTLRDLERWQGAFPHVAVEGELIAKEPWLSKQPNWFHAASAWLAKAERIAKQTNGVAEKPAEYDAYWQKI